MAFLPKTRSFFHQSNIITRRVTSQLSILPQFSSQSQQPFSQQSQTTLSIFQQHSQKSFSSDASAAKSKPEAFDIFQKLKDNPKGSGDADANKDNSSTADSKRKPSDKVLKLADQIMSLTLIEAADLCDLCQDRLTPGDGSALPGRMPFPHPMGMFGSGMGGGMGMMPQMGMPQMGMGAPAAPVAAAPVADASAADSSEDSDNKPAADKKEAVKEATGPVTLKLVSFDDGKKISVIKEVRALTGLGLKESKDLVESVPKVLQKGVPREDADGIVEKFKKAMAVVEYA